jgi:predicted nucleic acid-binding protein
VILLDTSAVLLLFERRHPGVIAAVRGAQGRFSIPLAVLAELHRGVESATGSTKTARQNTLQQVERRADLAIPTIETARHWGVLAAISPRQVGANDVWIAAAAIETKAQLVTADERLAGLMDNQGLPVTLLTQN